MRAHSLLVTRRCNQRCAFCDRVDPAAVDPSLARLLGDIAEAGSAGATTLVITGGEPTLRGDLLDLVRAAQGAGIADVALATNATRLTPAAAVALRDAGLTAAIVSIATITPESHRSLVSPATHPADVLHGLGALLDAGLRVTVRLPIARDLPPAAARLQGMRHAVPRLDRFLLAVIGPGEPTVASHQPLSQKDLSREITAAYDVAERLRVSLAFDPEHPAAPCTVPVPPRARRLFWPLLREESGPPARASEACAACAIAAWCTLSAEQLARFAGPPGEPGSHPITPIADAEAFSRPAKAPSVHPGGPGKLDVEKPSLSGSRPTPTPD